MNESVISLMTQGGFAAMAAFMLWYLVTTNTHREERMYGSLEKLTQAVVAITERIEHLFGFIEKITNSSESMIATQTRMAESIVRLEARMARSERRANNES